MLSYPSLLPLRQRRPLPILSHNRLGYRLQLVALRFRQIGPFSLGEHRDQEQRQVLARVERDRPVPSALSFAPAADAHLAASTCSGNGLASGWMVGQEGHEISNLVVAHPS